MSRQARYSLDGNKRVISLPCGMWAAQSFRGGKGINRTNNAEHRDPWENIGLPTDDRQRAIQKIGAPAP